MFTGITTDIGTVRSAEQRGDLRVTIACGYDMGTVDLGSSIACSGVCLTVVDKGDDWFAVDVSGETRSRTADGLWSEGSRLNLERSLRVGDELGGHIVAGHVDGVSLTVNDVREAEDGSTHFSVNIIPHTAQITTFGEIAAGRQLNVEIDVIARYLERMIAARAHSTA